MLAALRSARVSTLREGVPVTYSEDGRLMQLHPDGRTEVIGEVPPQQAVDASKFWVGVQDRIAKLS